MTETFKIEGAAALEAALKALVDAVGKDTQGKAAMRRALTQAAKPMEERAKVLAPKLTMALTDSIVTGTRLTKRQARMTRKLGKSAVEVHVGTADPAGVTQEFGTFKEPPQPFMGPAWDDTQDQVFEAIGAAAWSEIEKTAKRVASKQGKR